MTKEMGELVKRLRSNFPSRTFAPDVHAAADALECLSAPVADDAELDALEHWLNAKWVRHKEIEDRNAGLAISSLRTAISRAREENAELLAGHVARDKVTAECGPMLDAITASLAAKDAEIAALRKDAERWRFIRTIGTERWSEFNYSEPIDRDREADAALPRAKASP